MERDHNGETKPGVYIPRRDTNSRVVAAAGGPVFPGLHHRSQFDVTENRDQILISLRSSDDQVRVDVEAQPTDRLESQLFGTTEAAVQFFKQGSVGWSPSSAGTLDQVRLVSDRWTAEPLNVLRVVSTLFDDPDQFPADRRSFDSALLMANLQAIWIGQRGSWRTGHASYPGTRNRLTIRRRKAVSWLSPSGPEPAIGGIRLSPYWGMAFVCSGTACPACGGEPKVGPGSAFHSQSAMTTSVVSGARSRSDGC